jgi:hypothetical protein
MLAFFVVALTIGVAGYVLIVVLAALQATHDRISGVQTKRRQTTWLKPMSGARSGRRGGAAAPLTASEYTVITVVVLAVVAFEIWFFFYSGSSLDGRSGR